MRRRHLAPSGVGTQKERDHISCDCGQQLEPYIVEVDEEQYIENLCPQCAFPQTDVHTNSEVTVSVAGIRKPLPIKNFRLNRDAHNITTGSLTFNGTSMMLPGHDIDIQMRGEDIGAFHITDTRVSHKMGPHGVLVTTTEADLIGAK